ncbi:ribonuclease H-like domain-containing protein [Tanacetum coccineum]
MKVREHDKPSAQHSRFLKMFKQLRLEIGLKDALVEMPKFNKWLSSLLRNKEKLEEIAITTVNAECSAIIMNKVPEKLEDPGKFLIPCALQELKRTSALADSGASINLLPYSIYKKLELEALTPTRMTLELANRSISHPMGIAEDVVVRVDGFTFLADFVVVNFEPDPRVPIILGRPFLRTAKALIDLYEEKLTLRVGKDELVYYADKSEKNKDKNCVHAISIIDFSKEDPFSGSTTNSLHPSSSPVKTSDNIEKFTDELAPLDSLPSGNDDSTLKKEFHEVNFQVYSNPLFEFDESFRSSNVNPLFEENNKDVEIKSSSSSTLTSPEASELEDYLEKDSIPPGIDLTLPTTLEVLSSNPTFPTLTKEKVCAWETPMFFSLVRFVWKMMTRIAIRKKIICILATYLHKKPKPLSRPQEVEEIKEKEDEVSSIVPIDTIVMPIRITFDNPIDFNDHFSKRKDLKKDLPISFDSTTTSILPHPSFFMIPTRLPLRRNAKENYFPPGLLLVLENRHFFYPTPEELASPGSNSSWLSIHLVVYNEELAIPEQTATGKGISNPLMAGSLPKTTKPTNQDSRNRNQDSSRRTINVEETSYKAMVAIDGAGFDWSYMADDDVPTNMALMSFSDSEFNKSEFNLATYKIGLAYVEEQLVFYKKNEVIFCEQLAVLKRDISYKDSKISMFKSELEKLKLEKEGNQLKIKKIENASKSLDKLIGSQITDKSRKGVGFVSYNVVPPPPKGLFSPPKFNLSNSSLEEFQQPEFEGYGPKPSKSASEDTSNEVRESPDAPLIEELVSNEKKTVSSTVAKREFVRPKQQEKPVRKPVKYAEIYRSQTLRGNQKNWNNQKSQQLGSDFVMYNKTCFVCGSFDHVQAHCNYHQRERVESRNNYTRVNYNYSAKKTHPSAHKNMIPRAVLMKTGLKAVNTARPVTIAHPKTIVYSAKTMSLFSKSTQSTVKRPYQIRTSLTNKNSSHKVNTAKGNFYTTRQKAVNTARPNSAVVNAGHLKKEYQGYVDSGCSRHMIGNMSYLSDFKEFNGGYVTFGGGAKGGKITGKGTLKTSKLDFEDVYLVKELQFNLFSVSQMCNKKNNVLFTDTGCFVLSPDFKLADES